MIEFTEITDFNAPELDVYARLTEAQLLNRFEPKKGMFIAESPKVICRALDAGCRPVSLLVERSHCNEEAQAAIARCGDVPVYTAEMPILTQLTGFQLRGIITGYDSFVVVLVTEGRQQMIYKHAISTLAPMKPLKAAAVTA